MEPSGVGDVLDRWNTGTDPIGPVTLRRPEKLNALNPSRLREAQASTSAAISAGF